MDSQYYKDYYILERNHWWFLARAAILKRYIETNVLSNDKRLKILNVGVATGASTEMLQAFGEVTSIEYEQECIEFIRGKVTIEVMQGSILDLKFEESSFDLVCAFDVIEHVQDDTVAAKELMRVCTPGGSVLTTVPAFMSLWSDHDLVNHHFKRYRKREIEILFNDPDGQLIFSSYFNSILFFPIFFIRRVNNLIKHSDNRKLRSDFSKFKPGILNRLLFHLMKTESIFLSRRIRIPVGVSILHHWKKKM
jgi:SAM-dependent methyltransferase